MSVTQCLRPIFADRKCSLQVELVAVELTLFAAGPADEHDELSESLKGWRDSLRAYVEAIPEL
jgi:hypothetical protein